MIGDVIQLDEYRFRRKTFYDRKADECPHLNMVLVEDGHYIECEDCEAKLSPYWVLTRMLDRIYRRRQELDRRQAEVTELIQKNLNLLAARKVEKIWRSRMLPCCPHCGAGIFPNEGLGDSRVSREYELARRNRNNGTS